MQGIEDFAAEIQPEDENSALLVDMFDQRLQGLSSPHVRLGLSTLLYSVDFIQFNSSHPRLREFREAVSAAATIQQDEPDEEEDMIVDESQELAMGQVSRAVEQRLLIFSSHNITIASFPGFTPLSVFCS